MRKFFFKYEKFFCLSKQGARSEEKCWNIVTSLTDTERICNKVWFELFEF